MDNERLQHIGVVIMSTLVVLICATVCIAMFVLPALDPQMKMAILSFVQAPFYAAVQYWFGSSYGSKVKDQQIATLSQTISTLPPVPGPTPPAP